MKRISLRLLLVLLLALVLAHGALGALTIVWGPVLGDLTPTSARLAWYTSEPALGGGRSAARPWAGAGPRRRMRS